MGHPLDTIKVRLQSTSSLSVGYTGPWSCFTHILKNEKVIHVNYTFDIIVDRFLDYLKACPHL